MGENLSLFGEVGAAGSPRRRHRPPPPADGLRRVDLAKIRPAPRLEPRANRARVTAENAERIAALDPPVLRPVDAGMYEVVLNGAVVEAMRAKNCRDVWALVREMSDVDACLARIARDLAAPRLSHLDVVVLIDEARSLIAAELKTKPEDVRNAALIQRLGLKDASVSEALGTLELLNATALARCEVTLQDAGLARVGRDRWRKLKAIGNPELQLAELYRLVHGRPAPWAPQPHATDLPAPDAPPTVRVEGSRLVIRVSATRLDSDQQAALVELVTRWLADQEAGAVSAPGSRQKARRRAGSLNRV